MASLSLPAAVAWAATAGAGLRKGGGGVESERKAGARPLPRVLGFCGRGGQASARGSAAPAGAPPRAPCEEGLPPLPPSPPR